MEVSGVCDYCSERKVEHTCEVCGSQVCEVHKRERGCAVCNGGERTF